MCLLASAATSLTIHSSGFTISSSVASASEQVPAVLIPVQQSEEGRSHPIYGDDGSFAVRAGAVTKNMRGG